MKKIFAHIGILLSVALLGALSACTPKEIIDADAAGLGIKTFFPTKVVTNQPMTINGTGFSDVREVVFPGGVSVTDIEHVGNGMIRVTAPAGIAAGGGKLIVRTSDDEVESKQELTLGHTEVSGFSKMEGEEISGGEQLTVYGTDLEFICRVELIDNEGNPLFLEDEDFYRKGTSSVVITLPNKIFEGAWVGKLYTYDGQVIDLPELNYKPGGGGHWETVKKVFWTNPDPDGYGPANWNGTYRFCLEGRDLNPQGKECIAEIPQEYWDIIKNGTFYASFKLDPNWYQIRITNGHWSVQWQGADNDFKPGNMSDQLIPNDDGTHTLEITFGDDPLVETLDEKHLLLTGSGHTPMELFVYEDVWVEGGDEGHWEHQENTIWDVPTVFDGWSVSFVIGPEMFASAKEGDVIRTYITDKGSDFNFIYKHVDSWGDWDELQGTRTEGDGYMDVEITAAVLGELQSSGLRYQGVGFTITKVTLLQDVWIDGGAGHMELQERTLWDAPTVFDGWSVSFVVGPEMFAEAAEGGIIRVYITDKGDDFNFIFKHVDSWGDWDELQGARTEGDGYIETPITADVLGELQSSGLRFQGVGFTITKVTLIQEFMVGGGGGDDGPKVLWGEETAFADWSATIVIAGGMFADANEGDMVHVEIKDKGDDYNPIFKHVDSWGDWNEFQGAKVDGDGFFEAPIPAGALDELKSSGLRFQGVGFTIVKVTLVK